MHGGRTASNHDFCIKSPFPRNQSIPPSPHSASANQGHSLTIALESWLGLAWLTLSKR
ncbi:hypothetical protein HDN1F_26670 [gamma proteobacterium HdN1]|nr:hypothetical protein HDN1F_26670 [gamma proteobacterium HdN1]